MISKILKVIMKRIICFVNKRDRNGPAFCLLRMIKFFCLIFGFASDVHAEFFERLVVGLREYDGRVHLATFEVDELFHRLFGVFRSRRGDSECDKNFVGVKSRVPVL